MYLTLIYISIIKFHNVKNKNKTERKKKKKNCT